MSTKFIHIRSFVGTRLQEKGGTTIAYDYNPDTHEARFAIAKCSHKDNYCKRIGRDVATGRLFNKPQVVQIADDETTVAGAVVGAAFCL